MEKTVSVVIPVYNEENYIDKMLSSLLKQDYNVTEFILVDGLSTDKTVEKIRDFIADKPQFILLSNPERTVQHALNIGMKAARGEYIVRMDAHAKYYPDYISKCVETLDNTDAVNVGGPMIAKGHTPCQKAIAAAYHSPFALGGGKFHIEGYEGYADTVFLGAFKKSVLEELGYYDPRLPRSEDDDLNFRIAEHGYKVYITPKIRSVYYPRGKYTDLWKQYFEYGEWKVAVIKKHRRPARLSHIIPCLFVLFIIFGAAVSLLSPYIAIGYAAVWALYLALDIYASFKSKYLDRFSDKLRLCYVHLILHLSYGLGFIKGIFRFWRSKW
jgi:succinoglycan biosynthesis protein ExoA